MQTILEDVVPQVENYILLIKSECVLHGMACESLTRLTTEVDSDSKEEELPLAVFIPSPKAAPSPAQWMEKLDAQGGTEAIKEELIGKELPELQETLKGDRQKGLP